MPASDFDTAWSEFYQEYGKAMLAWQILESELATLFSRLTKIPPAMAMRIFYSARAFNGRIAVFEDALVAAQINEEARDLANSVIKKAKHYSEYRNKFAHDQPLLIQQGSPLTKSVTFDVVLVDGKGQFQADHIKKKYQEAAVTVAEIKKAEGCYRELADLVRDFWARWPRASLDKLRERLRALPNLGRPKGQAQPSAKPKRLRPQDKSK